MPVQWIQRPCCPTPEPLHVTRLFTAFQATYRPDFYFRGESHDFWELVYAAQGEVGVAADDEIFTLHRGQLILHPPMVFHRIWSAGQTAPTVIIFSFCAEGLSPARPPVRTLTPADAARVHRILKGIQTGFVMHHIRPYAVRPERLAEARRAVCLLEYLLLSVSDSGADPSAVRAEDEDARRYRELLAVMQAHLAEPLTLAQLAALARMSESTVKKLFARYAGTGAIHYFTNMKIRRAMQLLRAGARVNAAADALGFADPNYFSTVFRRVTGETPSAFRRGGTQP